MLNESAISEDFEKYDDADELRRLIRVVEFSQKHFLYFVCCNQVPKQNELIADVKKKLAGKPVKVIKFKKPINDLLGELRKRKIGANYEAVFVQGLEHSISSDTAGADNTFIYSLNISRDSFKKYLSCPLFLWLPEYAIVKITRHAPDFFSVRSGTFYFSNPPEQVIKQIFQNVTSDYLEYSSLPLTGKINRINILENLLMEYRGLHQEKQDKQAEMLLLEEIGVLYGSISEYRKAIDFYKQSLSISRMLGNQSGEISNLGNLGNTYNNIGNYQEAADFYKQSLSISEKNDDKQSIIRNLTNLGNNYFSLTDYHKAIEFQERALELAYNIGDSRIEADILGSLGIAYYERGQNEMAIEYHKKSLELARKIGNERLKSTCLVNLGNVYNSLGEHKKAIEYIKQSLEISLKIGDRLSQANDLYNMGVCYFSLGENKKSFSLFKEALAIFEKIESPNAKIVRQSIEKIAELQ